MRPSTRSCMALRSRPTRRFGPVTVRRGPRFRLAARERNLRPRTRGRRVCASGPFGGPDARRNGLFEATVAYWRRWLSQSRYTGRWSRDRAPLGADAEAVDLPADWGDRRGGGDIAARTAGWRAQLGVPPHLDPRRGVLLYALLHLGFGEEAEAFTGWLTERFRDCRVGDSGSLQMMYGMIVKSGRKLDLLFRLKSGPPLRTLVAACALRWCLAAASAAQHPTGGDSAPTSGARGGGGQLEVRDARGTAWRGPLAQSPHPDLGGALRAAGRQSSEGGREGRAGERMSGTGPPDLDG